MVYESVFKEKTPDYNIGPGEYNLNQKDIKTNLNNNINLHKNRPPFNQSSIRGNKEKKSYLTILKNDEINLENPINYYEKKTFNTYLNDKTTKNISFLSGQDRFHIKNDEKEDLLEDLKLLEDGSLTTNYSLPYEKEKELKKKFYRKDRLYNNIGMNLESEKIKEDYIKNKNKKKLGPGEYNINPKWDKNIVKWSGLTEIRIKQEKENKEDKNKKEKEKEKEKEQLNINLQNKIKNMKNDLFHSIQNKRKEKYNITEKKNNIKEDDEDPYIKPGLLDKVPLKRNNIRYQFFGSTSIRKSLNPYSETNEKVGPGSYNININSIEKRSMTGPKRKNILNNRKIIYQTKPGIFGLVIANNENICDKEKKKKLTFDDLYEIERDYKFGSQEIRFAKKNYNINTVGPGEYFREKSWIKNNFHNDFINSRENNINVKPGHNLFSNEDNSPGVGTYEISRSIEKDNNKLINKFTNNKVPFNSNSQRFFYDILKRKNQIIDNNAFDFYYPKDKKIIGGLINPESQNKSLNRNELESGSNGPGQYLLDSYFDWNKKSYNIKFA